LGMLEDCHRCDVVRVHQGSLAEDQEVRLWYNLSKELCYLLLIDALYYPVILCCLVNSFNGCVDYIFVSCVKGHAIDPLPLSCPCTSLCRVSPPGEVP
jgi:hypothetical protein